MDLWVDSNLLNADPRSSIDKIYLFLCEIRNLCFVSHKMYFYVKFEKNVLTLYYIKKFCFIG